MPGKSFNIVLFGDRSKASILYQYVHGEHLDPSVDSIVLHKKIEVQNKEANVQFVCTGSSYQESTLRKWATHGSGIILVYSSASAESYDSICKMLVYLSGKADHVPILLLGSFNENSEVREVSLKTAMEVAEIYSCMTAEVSEKTGQNISETFDQFITQLQYDRQPAKSNSMPSLSSSAYPIPARSRSSSQAFSKTNPITNSENWTSVKSPPKEWSTVESIESTDIFEFSGKADGFHFECGGTYKVVEEDIKLEFHDKYTPFYNLMYYGKEHHNYVGFSDRVGNVLVSFEETDKYTSNRVLVRTKRGDVRVLVPPGVTSYKDVVKHVKSAVTDLSEVKLKRISNTPSVDDLFSDFENKEKISHYKFGVLYVKEGQTDENEIYSNTETSPDFDEFLTVLGNKIELAGFSGNGEGLDTKFGTTGKYSVHTNFEGYDIMYHVAPYLPFQEHDAQRVERKRHLGNDVVLVVFKEGNTPFDPKCIRSHFNHIFVVVQVYYKTPEKTLYRVGVATKGGVDPFGPPLPIDGIFESGDLFRKFLLTKLINGERASMNGGEFRSTMVRTRNDMLAELTAKVARKKRTASGSFLRVSATTLLQALRADKDERRRSLPIV